ncbi:MAG TPA: ABC transporter permease [Candidatus Polarisedimenticolaceae bacterium]|nr:ABC transporter permease [Candidatus Polarisedimenticolaceae bacterium]
MRKMLYVAIREFLSTAATKGFVVGILLTPLLIGVVIVAMKYMLKEHTPPKIEGEVAVIDHTGSLIDGIRAYLTPEAMARRQEELKKKIDEATPPAVRAVAESTPQGQVMRQSLDAALGDVPTLHVVALDPATDLEQAKAPLKLPSEDRTHRGRVALVVVHPDVLVRAAGKENFGTYDLFVRAKLDDRLEDEVRDALREAIVEARIRTSGLEPKLVTALTHIDRVKSKVVTAAGEQETNEAFNFLVPMGFMALLLISVMSSGQYLLTTTVEEKANRVVEVLLSALSPMQLMVGKILGQMAVGLLILVLYSSLGAVALLAFASLGLLDFKLVLFLLIFFVLAYFTMASFMAAIGSAVNEMREAQTLMTPVMVMIMVPWLLWMPISRDPNSTFATVTSFIPPIGNFVMLLRLASTSPPPMWQAWLAVLIGAAGVYVALWFAAKVFRVGLLMYGKPPSFRTLVRWARMA